MTVDKNEFDRFYEFSDWVAKDKFVLSYSGYVSEDILYAVGQTLRQRLAGHLDNPAKIKNVFSIFVELMQNLIRYADEGPQPEDEEGEKPSFGIVMISDNGNGGMDMMAGNYVSPDEAASLSQRVNEISNLDADELRSLYKTKLRQPTEVQSKGGSIGLIEIARRASTPPTCATYDAEDGLKFFMIKVTV